MLGKGLSFVIKIHFVDLTAKVLSPVAKNHVDSRLDHALNVFLGEGDTPLVLHLMKIITARYDLCTG